MHTGKRFRGSFGWLKAVELLSEVLLCGPLLFVSASSASPADSLARARTLVADSKFAEAEPLIDSALHSDSLKNWAILLKGAVAEGRNQADAARKLYLQIPPKSAPGLEAKVRLFRLNAEIPDPQRADTSIVDDEALISELRTFGRDDLLSETNFAIGKYKSRAGQYDAAAAAWGKVRQLSPRSPFASRAREEIFALRKGHADALPAPSLTETLSEIDALEREDELIAALDLAQSTRREFKTNDSRYYKVLSAEEDVVRKMQRSQEADHILQTISADAPPELASQALLKITRNSWNANDQERTLKLLESFEARFPNSSALPEVHYIKGRVFEETQSLKSAREEYREVAESSSALPADKLRALRRLSWISLAKGDCAEATQSLDTAVMIGSRWFDSLRSQVVKLVSVPTGVPNREKLFTDLSAAREELGASAYWSLWCSNAFMETRKARKGSDSEEEKAIAEKIANLAQTLVSSGSYYYMFRAADVLAAHVPPPLSAALALPRTGGRGIGSPDSNSCTLEVPKSLERTLSALGERSVSDLARAEIDYFAGQNGPSRLALERIASPEGYRSVLTQVELLSRVSILRPALELTRSALSLLELGIGVMPTECRAFAWRLAFPSPYQDLFIAASRETRVPFPLLLAITRTESSFDQNARSRVGALGLMQLMPETAQLEGLKNGENLLEPQTNITLGAKHLGRLLAQFNQSQSRAVAAYNGGVSAVNRWEQRNPGLPEERWIELISYPETARYVKDVWLADKIYGALSSAAPNS